MLCQSAFLFFVVSLCSAWQRSKWYQPNQWSQQSGTIGGVLMELNLVYDVARCLSGPNLYTSKAHRFTKCSISAVPNIFNDGIHVTVLVSRAIIRSTSRIQFITTIKSIITLQYSVFISVLTCKIIFQGLDSRGKMIDNIYKYMHSARHFSKGPL